MFNISIFHFPFSCCYVPHNDKPAHSWTHPSGLTQRVEETPVAPSWAHSTLRLTCNPTESSKSFVVTLSQAQAGAAVAVVAAGASVAAAAIRRGLDALGLKNDLGLKQCWQQKGSWLLLGRGCGHVPLCCSSRSKLGCLTFLLPCMSGTGGLRTALPRTLAVVCT